MEARDISRKDPEPLNKEVGLDQEGQKRRNGNGGNGGNGNGRNEEENRNVKWIDLTAYTQRFQELILLCTRMVPDEEDRVERIIGVYRTT
ncbi:hypothetical protein Tco_1131732 [Tanacetum coccineum]|uniref:Uncharacterized protein n=1 Tax=Tanacetum coccineum TaxID=301880 RepID=A0ABQ5JB14_9ASTR